MSNQTILVPANGSYYTPAEKRRIDLIMGSEFFLLRNDASGTGERYRCKRCRAKHMHFTLLCIERPFDRSGLREMYMTGTVVQMEPTQQTRLALGGLRQPLGSRLGTFDLGQAHPQTARQLTRGEQGAHWFAFLLGTADPISARRAQGLADRIRGAGDRSFALQPLAAVAAAQPILQEVTSHA